MRKQLAIVILNYRTPLMTIDCIASVSEQIDDDLQVSVVVVDNVSGDGSAEAIEQAIEANGWTKWAHLVRSNVNDGFASGNNLGIRSVDAEFYLLLNSDTLVRPCAIRELLHAAEQHPEAGIIGPRLEWNDGEVQISHFKWPRPLTQLIYAAATGPITRMLGAVEVAGEATDRSIEAEWVSFAAVLIRREVIDQVGPLDEGYFMYFEDVDFCRRAWNMDWRVRYWPEARVVHLRGGSSPVKALGAAKKRRPFYYYASRSRYYARFYGRWGLWRANVYWIIGRAISLTRQIIQGKHRPTCEEEWIDNWTNALNPMNAANNGRTQDS